MYNVASYLWIHLLYLATHIHIRPEVQTPEPQYFLPSQFTINNCDRILENSSKSHMKSNVFLHVFNDISTYVYLFTEYFLHSFNNLNSCSAMKYYWECNIFHVAVINILK